MHWVLIWFVLFRQVKQNFQYSPSNAVSKIMFLLFIKCYTSIGEKTLSFFLNLRGKKSSFYAPLSRYLFYLSAFWLNLQNKHKKNVLMSSGISTKLIIKHKLCHSLYKTWTFPDFNVLTTLTQIGIVLLIQTLWGL